MNMELGIGGTKDADASHIAKGKRTKRLRNLSPCAVVTTAAATISSSSSASEEEHGSIGDYGSFSSTTTTTTFEATDQEEEDMANCLILLAQGKRGGGGGEKHTNNNNKIRDKSSTSSSNNSNRRFSEVTTAATAATKIGLYVYECKTCNRTFPSFQALGGHRASHKKPKLTPEEKKPQQQPQPPLQLQQSLPVTANCEFKETKHGHVVMTSPPLESGIGGASNNDNRGFQGGNNNKAKVHECSICGSEFTSGQALGGHMRRHRASTNTSAQVVDIDTICDKPKNVLELDLNLPALPEDDHWDSKFHLTATHNVLELDLNLPVLSAAPALVGCHY